MRSQLGAIAWPASRRRWDIASAILCRLVHSAGTGGAPTTSGHSTPATLAHDLLRSRTRILAITGAGISTESGVPDYRSPGRPPHRPTSHQQFMASHATRQRYWARSIRGFDTLAESMPNAGHYALAAAEAHGRMVGIITQNVDALHEKAGSQSVLHLHGTVEHMRCMSCAAISSRKQFQDSLRRLNPTFVSDGANTQSAGKEIEALLDVRDHAIAPGVQLSDQSANRTHTISPDAHVSQSVVVPSASELAALAASLRPDADSDLAHITDYSKFIVPSCQACTDGFGNARPDVAAANHLPGQPAGILKPDLSVH